jgi:hypothetical protein
MEEMRKRERKEKGKGPFKSRIFGVVGCFF